jgi:hypothetical protein
MVDEVCNQRFFLLVLFIVPLRLGQCTQGTKLPGMHAPLEQAVRARTTADVGMPMVCDRDFI